MQKKPTFADVATKISRISKTVEVDGQKSFKVPIQSLTRYEQKIVELIYRFGEAENCLKNNDIRGFTARMVVAMFVVECVATKYHAPELLSEPKYLYLKNVLIGENQILEELLETQPLA